MAVTHEVVFAPEAQQDLLQLYDFIAAESDPERAGRYAERLVAYCLTLVTFPERGRRRDDLRSGLRTTSFRRRVTIAFHVTARTVTVDRVLYGGRDLMQLFGEETDD